MPSDFLKTLRRAEGDHFFGHAFGTHVNSIVKEHQGDAVSILKS
jgi:hypothetical protein